MDESNTLLPRYINGGCISRRDHLVSLVAPGLPMRLNAARVAQRIRGQQARAAAAALTATTETVTVPAYRGSNPQALRMRDYLAGCVAGDIVAAIVHGSIATGEEIPYSDFDALVIVRDEVFRDARRLAAVAGRLDRARAFMIELDPLQHHGWFVLAEHQLLAYPESYLPIEVLRHARVLFPPNDVQLHVVPVRDPAAEIAAVEAISRSIASRIGAGGLPLNLFDLKSLLSQFMLLPALYVQARDGRGVFKKDSFARARGDFDAALWRVMDDVSEIRAGWTVQPTALQRRVLQVRGKLARRVVRRFAPPIPAHLAARLTGDFYDRMQRLALAFPAALQRPAYRQGDTAATR